MSWCLDRTPISQIRKYVNVIKILKSESSNIVKRLYWRWMKRVYEPALNTLISSESHQYWFLGSILIFCFSAFKIYGTFYGDFWILKQFRLLLIYLKAPSEKYKTEHNLLWLFSFPVWASFYLFLIMNLSAYSTYLFF